MLCYIGVGSNVGNRLRFIKKALGFLKATSGIKIKKVSPAYVTKPCGGPKGQGDYLNLVIKIDSNLTPGTLLKVLKKIEKQTGRKPRNKRWAEREIDLDILFYGNLVKKRKGLEIPHPRLAERYFVLKPLSVIAPGFNHPVFKKNIKNILRAIEHN